MTSKDQFESIFKKIDQNEDGIIDIDEVRNAFKTFSQEINADELLSSVDNDKSNSVTIDEFINYMNEREKCLKVAFSQMDKNNDGNIDAKEIKHAMKDLGIEISLTEADQLLTKLDKDKDMSIDFTEWRDFLWMSRARNLHEMLTFMNHSSSFDLGDNVAAIPDDFSWEDVINGTVPKTIFSGVTASSVSRTVAAPLERLKIMRQASSGFNQNNLSLYKSLQQMIQEGGWRSLWRGNAVNCFKMAPEVSARSVSYWYYKSLLIANKDREILPTERLIAGSSAGATTVTLVYPLEILKTRMCIRQTNQYSSVFDCFRQIRMEGGWKSLYKGYSPHLLAVIPYAGIDLTLFETFKAYYMRNIEKDKSRYGEAPPVFISLLAGAISSLCGQLLTYPLALIRTKFQISDQDNLTIKRVYSETVKSEGYKGLYRGMVPNLLKAVPSVSISYAVFDQLRGYLGVKTY